MSNWFPALYTGQGSCVTAYRNWYNVDGAGNQLGHLTTVSAITARAQFADTFR